MNNSRGYYYGIFVFGLMAVFSLTAVAAGYDCCSKFSIADVALGERMIAPGSRSQFSVRSLIMDWPRGYREIVMTLYVSLIGLAAIASNLVMSGKNQFADSKSIFIFRFVSGAFVAGTMFILAIYVFGYFGYSGPLVFLSYLGASVLIVQMNFPGREGFVFAIPLTVFGIVFAGLISMTLGIGWD